MGCFNLKAHLFLLSTFATATPYVNVTRTWSAQYCVMMLFVAELLTALPILLILDTLSLILRTSLKCSSISHWNVDQWTQQTTIFIR